MNDIRPPKKKPLNAMPPRVPARPLGSVPPRKEPSPRPLLEPSPVKSLLEASTERPKKRRVLKIILWIVGSIVAVVLALGIGGYLWYTQSLAPVNAGDTSRARVEIESGLSPSDIGQLLESKKLIRSKEAFDIYTRLTETRSKLQAGTYSLSPSESVEAIVAHLVAGRVDQFSLTFLPGATLAENRKVLVGAGYSEQDVDKALVKPYDHPLLKDKPASADLEGYIYGETYTFDSSASVEGILTEVFDYYYTIVQKDNLIEGYKAQGLNLYQGITLASIIQREAFSAADQKQVAQVFFKRLSIGMMLGSDVTYQYAAKKLGVDPHPDLDSPYNTRKFTGLPPGPIATPGRTALQAVAAPAAGDYLYFVSGDDDKTYFSHTLEEHEANAAAHCHVKCSFF